MNAKTVTKIRRNASSNNYKGSKYRRWEIREYKSKGYRTLAEENHYGMIWPGTEGIFSAVKRKFAENCVSRSIEGLEAEGYQRSCMCDYLNNAAKEARRIKNTG